MNKKLLVFPLFFVCFFLMNGIEASAQTLIINEVSNGPTGNQEYVELLVIDTNVVFNCNATTPPCIDIRGWIFDDNSGYHGSGGVATGAVRFSQDVLWSCVPVGTIILIYNDADINPAIPSNDLSLADGNCKIVAPISNATLFESNLTTPGAVACSYPASGWTAGGSWNNTLLANPGDCARIVNLAGCEVFSVCWASNNLNNLIYFNSAGSGSQNCWYFNGGNPVNQADWSEGSASSTPADQTPGAPNNAANAAYISQFNNNCTPITPLVVTANSTNAACTCTGTATASASGSIPGYTYVWYNSSFIPIGQTAVTATGLCAGTYYVIATSSIGCSDTASVTIISTGVLSVSVNSTTICSGQSANLIANGAASYSWSSGGTGTSISVSPASTTTYTVTGTSLGCTGTAVATVTVNPLPTVSVNSTTVCSGTAAMLTATPSLIGGTYFWSPGGAATPSIIITPSSTTTYTVTYILNGCSNTGSGTITVNAVPVVSVNSSTICAGQSSTLNASGAASYFWSPGAAVTASISVTPSSTTTYTVVGTALGCSGTAVATVTVNPSPISSVSSNVTINPGASTTLIATGGGVYNWYPITGLGCSNCSTTIVTPAQTTDYCVAVISSNGCADTACVKVTVEKLCPALIDAQIPNVFSPNNDGKNDFFHVAAWEQCIESIHVFIYNRWGIKIIESTNVNIDWDGRLSNGAEAAEGTYYYVFDVKNKNGEQEKFSGFITLIR